MTTAIKAGQIKDHTTGEMVDFEIFNGVDFSLSQNADVAWGRFNLDLVQHLYDLAGGDDTIFRELYKNSHLEDKHWRWVSKSMHYVNSDYEWFYLKAGNDVQGTCVFHHPKKSNFDSNNIFYIEYLATAPWNRVNKLSSLKFKGIGTILLKESLLYAINILGYRPGFSLHSLPKAIDYYSKIGMMDFGPDPTYHNLNYFEMEQKNSEVFANG